MKRPVDFIDNDVNVIVRALRSGKIRLTADQAPSIYSRAINALGSDCSTGQERRDWLRIKQWAYQQIPFKLTQSQVETQRPPKESRICSDCNRGARNGQATRCIRPIRRVPDVVGQGVHRSGWPYAVSSLQSLRCRHGILFDDFVEQRFSYQHVSLATTEPWVGIFHHPPKVPEFVIRCHHLEAIFERVDWRESQPFLRGAIALSEYLAQVLRTRLGIPVVAIKHPMETAHQCWRPAAYLGGKPRRLLQLGFHLRNTRAIFQVPKLAGIQRMRLLPTHGWVADYDQSVIGYWRKAGMRREGGEVQELGFVSPATYDDLLASCAVLTELFDASANNVVVECIARNTPIIINRHPAVEEYLTPDYPLYFDDITEVPSLLSDERVMSGHEFLLTLDKAWLSGDHFRRSVRDAIRSFEVATADAVPLTTRTGSILAKDLPFGLSFGNTAADPS